MASDLSHTHIAIRKSKIPAIIVLLAAISAAYPALFTHLSESRFYRDLANLTPFKGVEIHKVVIEGNTMKVWGEFEKVRCYKQDDHAYTRKSDGYNYPADFSVVDEDPLTPANRPSAGRADLFGPWVISSQIENPDYASYYPEHRCSGVSENNLFFDLPWEPYERKEE